jgi:flagellar hook-associated protein 1 FlgK
MFNSLDTLKTNSGDSSVRNQFISNAEKLMTYFNGVGTKLQDLQTSINDEIKTTVDSINSTAKKIAVLNKQINVIEVQGGHANDLRDQRALLVDQLSEILPVEVKETKVANSNYPDMYTGATYFELKVSGKLVVDSYDYVPVEVTTRENKHNQADVDGLYDLRWSDTGERIDMNASTMSGSLKAMFDLRDGNNAENLQGTVIKTTGDTVKISSPNITSVNYMNMPETGILELNGQTFPYTNFSVEFDENGKAQSYTFELENIMDGATQTKVAGGVCSVGQTLNYKGIAYYQNQMSLFLRSFAEQFNNIEKTGKDLNGNKMGSFFVANNLVDGGEYSFDDVVKATAGGANLDVDNFQNKDTYYKMTSLSCSVAETSRRSPNVFATTERKIDDNGTPGDTTDDKEVDSGNDSADLVTKLLKLQSETKIFRDTGGSDFLQVVYSDITVDTQESDVFTDNFKAISTAIDKQRQGVSGVDEDEEALDLVKFQNAYNLASKAIQILSQMYDRLITQTGV